VAAGLTPFEAVTVSEYVPPVPAPGVPDSVAVPFPLFAKMTPDGNGPLALNDVGVGNPFVVTMNVPVDPTVKVVDAELVIAGA